MQGAAQEAVQVRVVVYVYIYMYRFLLRFEYWTALWQFEKQTHLGLLFARLAAVVRSATFAALICAVSFLN